MSSHPAYATMVKGAIKELNDKKGSSRQAILKLLKEKYALGDQANKHVNAALKKLLEVGVIVRSNSTGATGANGSFKMASVGKIPGDTAGLQNANSEKAANEKAEKKSAKTATKTGNSAKVSSKTGQRKKKVTVKAKAET